MRLVTFFAILILLGYCSVYAQGSGPSQNRSLRGLDTLVVIVDIDDDLSPSVSADRLKTLTELKLRQSGFSIREEVDYSVDALCHISLTTVPIEMYDELISFAVSYNFEVNQPVTLRRIFPETCVASTWSYSGVGNWGTKRVKEMAETIIGEAIDDFLNCYLSVKDAEP